MGSGPLKEKSAFPFIQVAYSECVCMFVCILFCSSLVSSGVTLTVLWVYVFNRDCLFQKNYNFSW